MKSPNLKDYHLTKEEKERINILKIDYSKIREEYEKISNELQKLEEIAFCRYRKDLQSFWLITGV